LLTNYFFTNLSYLYTVVFGRLKKGRIAKRRERKNEKREEIGQQLHNALRESPPPSLDKIQTLVAACTGALSFADDIGDLPLHVACYSQAPLEVVRYLVQEYPESLRVPNDDGYPPLHFACTFKAPLEVVRYLVQEYPKSLQVRNNFGNILLHIACSYEAPLEVVRYLVQEYPEALEVTGNDGYLPLHFACYSQAPLEVVQYLVQEYPESLQVSNNDGKIPLHIACYCKAPLEVVRYLVQKYPESLGVAGIDGKLPLHIACYSQAPMEVVRYLVQEYPEALQVPNNDGDLPLHFACTFKAPLEVVRYLVQEYPKSLQVTDKNGSLPFHYACGCEAPLEVVQYLVQEYPESLRVTDNDGDLPLHIACIRQAWLEVVQYLVQEYPESLQAINNSRKKAIDLANNHEVLTWMESAMAGEVSFEPLSSPQPSVQPVNPLSSPDKETLASQIDVDPSVSSQQSSLRSVQTPNLTASLSTTALPSDDNTKSMQSHMNPNKDTEGADFVADSERFGEEASTEDPDKETLASQTDGDPSVSSQQSSLRSVQTPNLTASVSTTALPSDDKTKSMQSHMNPNKDTEGGDFVADSERFGEEASTEDRKEEGAADFKRMREEMKVLMEHANQVTTESGLRESEKGSDKLSALVRQWSKLNLLADEKRLSIDEKEELDAIRSSKDHWDFYVMLVQKLRCMVTACETRVSGMVACGSDQSFASFIANMVQGQSLASLKKTKIGVKIGVLVAEAIKWSIKQIPFPFVDAVGSVIQTLATIKEERDKCLAVARVAHFATIAAIGEDADGVHRTIERTAMYLIRSRRFVGTKEEFGAWRQGLLNLMAEPGCTQSKAEACLVADKALATLMTPVDDCPVRRIVEGLDRNTRLDEALAAVILGSSVLEIKKLETFKAGMLSSVWEVEKAAKEVTAAEDAEAAAEETEETICTDGNGSRLQEIFEPTTLDPSAQMQALENRIAELSALHATREEAEKALRNSSRKLAIKFKQLEKALGGNGGSGSGAVQMHADFREQYKDKVQYLDGENVEHGHYIDSILKELAIQKEQVQQLEEVLRTHGLPNQETSKKERFRNACCSIL
jgi:ankyrin repeat protein